MTQRPGIETFNPQNLDYNDFEISNDVVMAEVDGRYFPILERMGSGATSFIFRTIHVEFRNNQEVSPELENDVLNEVQSQLIQLYERFFNAEISETELKSQIKNIAEQVGLSIRDAVFKIYKPVKDVAKIAEIEQKQHLAIWSRRSDATIPDIHPGPVLKVKLINKYGLIDSAAYAIEMVKVDLTDEGKLLRNWVPDGMTGDRIVAERGSNNEISDWAKKTFNIFISQIGPAYYNMFLHGVANSDISPANLGVGRDNAILFDFAQCKVVKFNLANAIATLNYLSQIDPVKAIVLANRVIGTIGKLDPSLDYKDQILILKEDEQEPTDELDQVILKDETEVEELQDMIRKCEEMSNEMDRFGVAVLQDMFDNPRFNNLERKLHSALMQLDKKLKLEKDTGTKWMGIDKEIIVIHPYSTNLARLDTENQTLFEMISTLDETIELVQSCLNGETRSIDSVVNDRSITLNAISEDDSNTWEKSNTLSKTLKKRVPIILLNALEDFEFTKEDLEEIIAIYNYHKGQLSSYNPQEAAAYYGISLPEIQQKYGNLDFTRAMKNLIDDHSFDIPWGQISGLQFVDPYQLGYTPTIGNPVFPMQAFNPDSFDDYQAANIYGLVALFLEQIGAPYHVTFLAEGSKTRTEVSTKEVINEEKSGFWARLLQKTIDSFYAYLGDFESRAYPFVPEEVFIHEMLNSKYSRLRFLDDLEDGVERLKALHSLFENFFRAYYDVFFLKQFYPDDPTTFLAQYSNVTKFFEEAYNIIFSSQTEA